ncbi:MAG: Uma2 family endonuclease [Gammaproteobacteria bacterium]|nr:MAG: Uma2 family endonuclease [Gammaproteobacteria bacterium]
MKASLEPHLTPEAYLEEEARGGRKCEYLDGTIWAMVGASDAHVTIAGNLFVFLRQHLSPPCRTYISGMKVHIPKANAFFYPDVLITCDPRDAGKPLFKEHPCLIAEVLSPSTEAFDRGQKFAIFRMLDSLTEYLLIDSTRISVERFSREKGRWVLYPHGEGETVTIASLGLDIPVNALYQDVTFP